MNTPAEIEMVITGFSAKELSELERFIRKARREKEQAQRPSLRDIEPASVGRILKPVSTRSDWYDEMLEAQG
jgi:hypothetical protein